MRAFFACFTCILFFCGMVTAQPFTKEDSLKSAIIKSPTPEAKLKNVLAFCDEWESINPDTLKTYSLLARQLAAEQNDKRASLLADYYIAAWLFQVNKIDTSLALTKKTISAYQKDFSYDEILARLMSLKSNILIRTDHISEMTNSGFALIKLAEEHKDTAGMARGMVTIGNANMRLKKYDETLSWYLRALQLLNNPAYKQKLSFIYNNIAIVFYHLEKEDSAIYYVKQGIHYSQQSGNLTSLSNAWILYGGLMAEYKHIREAEAAFNNGIEVRKKTGDVYYVIADMAQLALFYCDNNEPQKAITICNEALELLKNNGNDFSNRIAIYEELSKAYLQVKDYKNYSGALQQQLNLKDSIYEKNSAEEMAEMQAKYDLQKRENVIMQQKFAITKKNYLLTGSLVFSLIIIAASYFIFREYRRRQKIKTAVMLSEEKRKADEAVAGAEDAERKRIAADLHDNMGAMLSHIKRNASFILDSPQSLTEEEKKKYLSGISNIARDAIIDLRETIWVLSAETITMQGFADKLKSYLNQQLSDWQNIHWNFRENITQNHVMTMQESMHIFRIAQELIHNIIRHSNADMIDVSLASTTKGFELIVQDNGKGFDPHQKKQDHYGLENMKERAKNIGAIFSIESIEGKGTKAILIR